MIKEWLAAERVGRIEEGTSQDMFPTNGSALFAHVLFSMLWLFIFGVYILNKV